MRAILLVAILSGISLACTSRSEDVTARPTSIQKLSSKEKESDVAFKFENHSEAESAQRELISMFPPGTPVQTLLETIKPIVGSSQCTASLPGEPKYIFCRYSEAGEDPDYFDPAEVRTIWAMVSYQDDQDNIRNIQVERGSSKKENFFSDIEEQLVTTKEPRQSYNFRFENYASEGDASNAQVSQKLQEVFPPNTPVSEFNAFMQKIGAKCYGQVPGDDLPAICRYQEKPLSSIFKTWIVSYAVDPDNQLKILEVKHGYTGP